MTPNRTATFMLCALVMFLDGYDLSAMPLAVPHLVKAFAIKPELFGTALSAVLLGLGLGAVLVAPIGDRLGRRPTVIVAAVAMALTTLGTATGSNVWSFALWRLATGIALGVCLPNVTSLVSELAPLGRRAAVLTIVSCGISLGGVGAGLIAPALVRFGGWQAIFIAPGVLTLAIAAGLLLFMVESPKLASEAPASGFALLGPLEPRYRLATIVFIGLYTVNALVLYMISGWLPTVLPRAGFSVAAASQMSAVFQGGGLIGGLMLSVFLDRSKTVPALGTAYLLVAVVLAGFSLVPAEAIGWSVLLLIAGGGVAGAHLAIMAVGTGFYPARMTSAAIGLAVAVARLGAIAGPMLGSRLIGLGFAPGPFFLAVIAPVLVCAGLVLLIPMARARTA